MLIAVLYLFGFFTSALAMCCKCTSSSPLANNICINTTAQDCAKMPAESKNADVKKLNCVKLGDSQCKKVAENGECIVGPTDEAKYKPPAASPSQAFGKETKQIAPPTLGIDIPGVVFSDEIPVVVGKLSIPWFAQYLSAIHKYLLSISIVAAAVMLVYGGTLYIIASSGAKVASGKEILKNALIGLVLIIAAYTILATINPAVLELQAVRLDAIKPFTKEHYEDYGDVKQ